MSGNRLMSIIVFTVVFILMMMIGLASGVSLAAALERALSATVLFTALSFGTYFVITRCVIKDLTSAAKDTEEDNPLAQDNAGQMLDILVSEPPEDEKKGITDTSEISQTSGLIEENAIVNELDPLVTRQIDPNVEKVINSDPRRMAEIIKKMGFDE